MLAIVLQSIIVLGGQQYTPPILSPNGTYPSLNASNYLKIQHIACVNSTTAANPDICPNAACK
jgi:hypothetical protein